MDEVKAQPTAFDLVRHKYLARLADKTGRNVIVYYSGWLQKGWMARYGVSGFEVDDHDKSSLMATIHQLDRSRGLDLVLHTPGGDVAATESIIHYLHLMFDRDIRAIIPQLAMSAGTMIALACKQLVMGKHSNLGPIDPQIHGIPAHGIIEEFERARREIRADPSSIPLWQPVIAKYQPALMGECEKAIKWASDMVQACLVQTMFDGEENAVAKAKAIVAALGDHAETKAHARHISTDQVRDLGIRVVSLEDDQELQDCVLSVHHACMQTLAETAAIKLIENHDGMASISTIHDRGQPA